jgi:hypothetical protein
MQDVMHFIMLIINEHFYDHNMVEFSELRRYGTDIDESRLRHLFEKLKFHVNIKCDLTEMEIREEIKRLEAECEANGNGYDAITLIILSHCMDGYINGTDFDNKINVSRLLSVLSDSHRLYN